MPLTVQLLSTLIFSFSFIHQALTQQHHGIWEAEEEPQFSPDVHEVLPSPDTDVMHTQPEEFAWSPQPQPFYSPEPSASPYAAPTPPAKNILLSGKYITNFELLTFKSEEPLWDNGNKLKYTAIYAFRSGQLFAVIDLNTRRMTGNWTQSVAERVCQNPGSDSSMYWGTFYFDFTWDWNSFHGKWGFCHDEPTNFWSGDTMASLGLT